MALPAHFCELEKAVEAIGDETTKLAMEEQMSRLKVALLLDLKAKEDAEEKQCKLEKEIKQCKLEIKEECKDAVDKECKEEEKKIKEEKEIKDDEKAADSDGDVSSDSDSEGDVHMILNNLRGLTEGLAGTPGVEETSDHLDGLLTNLVEELASAGVVSVSEEEDEKEGKDEPPAKRAKVEEAA